MLEQAAEEARRAAFDQPLNCVREMAKRVVESFTELPDDSIITIRQINEESIHQHDAVAERVASMGDLRRELAVGDGYK